MKFYFKRFLILFIFWIISFSLYRFVIENCFNRLVCSYESYFNQYKIEFYQDILSNSFNFNSSKIKSIISSKCSEKTNLIIFIHSINPLQRQAIRLGWIQKLKDIKSFNISYLFLTGNSINVPYKKLHYEISKYKDILYMKNLTEDYSTLSIKSMKMLKWFNNNCKYSFGMFKMDDDLFLNVEVFENLINSYLKVILSEPMILGKIFYDSRPSRSLSSKHYVTYEEYKKDYYPPYATGGGYFLNGWAVKNIIQVYELLQKTHKRTKLFKWEDVTITGILVSESNRLLKGPKIAQYNTHRMFNQYYDNPCLVASKAVTHSIIESEHLFLTHYFNGTNLSKKFCYNYLQSFLF